MEIIKTIATHTLTLKDPHNAFESFCVQALCDFIWNYSGTYIGPLVTSIQKCAYTVHASTNVQSFMQSIRR